MIQITIKGLHRSQRIKVFTCRIKESQRNSIIHSFLKQTAFSLKNQRVNKWVNVTGIRTTHTSTMAIQWVIELGTIAVQGFIATSHQRTVKCMSNFILQLVYQDCYVVTFTGFFCTNNCDRIALCSSDIQRKFTATLRTHLSYKGLSTFFTYRFLCICRMLRHSVNCVLAFGSSACV